MKPALEIFRGELERLFSTTSLKSLCSDYFGLDPDKEGLSDDSKAVFARRIVEWCEREKAVEALLDVVSTLKKGMIDPRVKQVYETRFPLAELSRGTEVAGFIVEDKVKDGGLGSVYRCRPRDGAAGDEGRGFGLKVIHAEHALDGHAVRRFVALMRLLKAEPIPSLQRVAQAGILADGRPFVIVQWEDGTPLSEMMPVEGKEALLVLGAVLDALATVHERGLVHGDLNPGNVLVRRGADDAPPAVTLLGLGVDRLFYRASPSADAKRAFGHFNGLAPEQARGGQPEVKSDVYALGILLFEMISGKRAFEGPTAIDVLAQHLLKPLPKLSEVADDPRAKAFEDLVSKLAAKEMRHRIDNLEAIRRLLDDARRALEEIEARTARTGSRADIEIFAEALIENPDDEEAFTELHNEAAKFNAWGAAVEVLEEAALATEDKAMARRLLLEAAALTTKHLKNYDKARGIYNQFLASDAGDQEVKQAIRGLLRAEGRYEELIGELAARAEAVAEPAERMALIREIADVYELKLRDFNKAFEYRLACLDSFKTDTALLDSLERLAAKTSRFAELATACTAAAQAAESAAALDAAVLYYERTGRYYLERIDQPAYALTCFQKVLEHRPTDTGALQAVADLYRGAQQWTELAEIMVRLGEVEQTPTVSRDRLVEAAKIYYERLSDSKEAMNLLAGVVAEDRTHGGATQMLIRIYEESKAWDKLAKLLADTVAALADPGEKQKTYFRLGELNEDRLNDLKAARDNYEQALLVDSKHLDSLKGLERVFARLGDAAKLKENLEQQLELSVTPKQRVLLLERLADICEEEFKDYNKAVDYLRQILETDPTHRSASIFLSRLYRKTERWEDLVAILEKRAKGAEDEEKKELLQERAEVIREKIGDAQRAAAAFAEVASLGAHDALETLAAAQEEAGSFEEAIATLAKMADAAGDVPTRVGLLYKIAGIQLEKLGKPDEAAQTLRKVRDLDPTNRKVIAGLRHVLIAQGNYAAAMDTLNDELALVEGSSARADLLAEMGVIARRHIGDDDRAVKFFEQSLGLDEGNFVAGDNVSELYRSRGDWDKALKIYERWADAADSLPKDKQAELFTQMGEAYDQLGRHDDALKIFKRAADIAGEDMRLIRRLGEIALAVGSFAMAKEQLGKFLDRAGDSLKVDEKIELFVKLGRACLGAADPTEAAKLARQATVMAPEHRGARLLLADVHEQRGDFRGMVDALIRVTGSMEKRDEERIPLLRRAASALFEKLKDADGAAGLLKEALDINANDRAVLGDLLKIHTATKHFQDLIDVVLRIAKLVDDPGQLARYYLTVGKIYRRELKETQKSVSYFEMAVEQDPTLDDAEKGIVEIFTETQQWEKLEAHYKKAIARLPKDALAEEKLEIYEPLADLLINKLDRRKDAILISEAIVRLVPENTAWQERLSDLYGWNVDYAAKATELHRRMLDANPARVASIRQLYRVFSAEEDPDKVWCAASLLAILNQASPEERTYYREYQLSDLPTIENRLQAEQWSRLLIHHDMDQTISSIFSVIAPAIFKVKAEKHSRFGVSPEAAVDVGKDKSPFAAFINFAATALGIDPPPLYLVESQQAGFALVETSPPALLADKDPERSLRDRMGVAFSLGQQMTLLYPGLFVRRLVSSGTELSAWLLASIKTFVPALPVPSDLAGKVSDRLSPIREAVDVSGMERLQGHVQTFVSKTPDVNLKRWARAVDYTMDRAGLLLAGDIAVAVRVLKTQISDKQELADRLKALTLFVVSDEHFKLRRNLGTALENG